MSAESSLDRRRAEIGRLNHWPKELAAIIAEYSELTMRDTLDILMPGDVGTKIITCEPDVVSIYWNRSPHRQIFLRCGGVQSNVLEMNDLLLAIYRLHFGGDRPRYHKFDKFFVACNVNYNSTSVTPEDFASAFVRLLEEVA